MDASADADAKALVEVRNKVDETQRRLKSEKGEHDATSGLLEEERAKYVNLQPTKPYPKPTDLGETSLGWSRGERGLL